MTDVKPLNVLFVCSRNQWRSPTGEAVFRKMAGVATRSAGTSRNARRKLSLSDIRWADLILVMEEKHASRIRADFRQEVRHKALHVLDIPDDYRYMDEDLIELFHEAAGPIIANAIAD
ncbi:low molecular weight protein tyrosine phosphatase family protein [Roseibium aggregatum]|uniref:low molecular weight protein tyrosine phosphatase family protein n=1 Tax=Roseibium aggregatum TaxID=187304 RepID=UPI001AD8CCB2|nr:phosphotyrosine protein phosphatase [Roseibium aggregatum]